MFDFYGAVFYLSKLNVVVNFTTTKGEEEKLKGIKYQITQSTEIPQCCLLFLV